MAPPLLWLVSDAAAQVTGRRFLAVHCFAAPGRGGGEMRRADRPEEHCDNADRAPP